MAVALVAFLGGRGLHIRRILASRHAAPRRNKAVSSSGSRTKSSNSKSTDLICNLDCMKTGENKQNMSSPGSIQLETCGVFPLYVVEKLSGLDIVVNLIAMFALLFVALEPCSELGPIWKRF